MSKTTKARAGGEPDSAAALSRLMKDAPSTREQHTKCMVKRGAVRRRIEDHLLEKASNDLW
ncbi:hypothetical protein [Chitinimonas sp.]|uniref:hypothetical protein n=1 Tax=Chitinimonas sp. TaxID=1934313 RepID=UPI0035AE2134